MKKPLIVLLISMVILCSMDLRAQLRLPAILSSGMVLQQNDSVALWGWAGPGEKVYVTTSWNKRTDSAIVSNLATWKLKVKTPAAGGPYTIDISSRNKITLQDVMIGEVWVCSGQSNMEWNYHNGTSDIAADFVSAKNPNIRFFHIQRTGADYPQDDVKAAWTHCDSNSIKTFSSIGYFFGKKLQQDLNVPIGLINASWGGTPAETWTPEQIVHENTVLKAAASKLNTYPWWPSAAGKAYNGMIAPVTNFSIAGAIWYQGESNTTTYDTYQQLFTTMIDAWRAVWKREFPFYFVQIAPYKYGTTNIGALLQEAQTRSMTHPKTGMVVITDLVDSVTNIHPSRKRPVGERLANWALAETYGKTGLNYMSPVLTASVLQKDKILLRFANAMNGFTVNGQAAEGFFVSAAGQEKWYPAKAKILNNTITVWSPELKNPYYVRYGFGNTLIGNVSSKEGLPIIPFRTDKFAVEQVPVK